MKILDLFMNLEYFKEYMTSRIMVSADFFFVFIIILIILMRLKSKTLNSQQFENMIYIIIIGFLVKILILYQNLSSGFSIIHKITFFNYHFLYSPGVLYLHIFICIIAICLFIALLDYFYYEKFISYELLY